MGMLRKFPSTILLNTDSQSELRSALSMFGVIIVSTSSARTVTPCVSIATIMSFSEIIPTTCPSIPATTIALFGV